MQGDLKGLTGHVAKVSPGGKGSLSWERLEKTLFVLPKNDGESQRALELLRCCGAPLLHVSAQAWGACLEKELPLLDPFLLAKADTLLFLELPPQSPQGVLAEQAFLEKGFQLRILDHHFSSFLDRFHKESSLEQLCHYLGWRMDSVDRALAVQDRSYIPGLKALGLSQRAIYNLRLYDARAQGLSSEYFLQRTV